MPTHSETYRRFSGTLRTATLRFLPLAAAGIRTAAKRKLVLLLLLAFPAAWAVVFSFNIYAKYAMAEGNLAGAPPGFEASPAVRMASRFILDIRRQLAEYFNVSRTFSLVVTAWYGAGLLAEDRRLGAHLLLFARPLTRFDYVFGRFLTVWFFGLLSTLAPGLLILVTAIFSAPEWTFITEEGDAILGVIAYAVLTPFVFSLVSLAASSLASRRTIALAGTFAAILIPHAIGSALRMLRRDVAYRIISPFSDLGRAGHALLGTRAPWYDWPAGWSFLVLGLISAVSIAIIVFRFRRLDVVP
jgi:hypothetical protein